MTDHGAPQRTSSLADSSGRGRTRRRRGIYGRSLEPLFGRVLVAPETVDRLKSAYGTGTVVHTLRSSRLIDPLYIQYFLEQVGLPPPEWMHDHNVAREAPTAEALCATVARGAPSLLFLRRPSTWLGPSPRYTERFVQALLELQAKSERPILLVPEALIWLRRAAGLERSWVDTIFGDREAPGRWREMLGFVVHHRNARYHVGAPIDLRDALQREAGKPLTTIAKKVRWLILHHLAREEQLRTGPIHRSAARTRQSVLSDPEVRRVIETVGARQGGIEKVEARADELLKVIAADMRYGWLRTLDILIDWVWRRIYDGINVDKEGFDRLRSAARQGPVVVVPSHKSHVDYIVMSQVFFKEGMMPPHIAAGENLNFWPMGLVFRRSGAFFIRRGFRGDKLYTAVFSGYVRRLLRDGHVLEFFIEGGRSRTGKLLPPRTGMLSICIDPVADGHVSDIQFVPVSIGYEKVIEAKAYANELAGGEKKKEDMASLLTSGPKVLRSRYGRVYVDFDEPISLRQFASAREIDLESLDADASGRRLKQLTTQLGHRIVYGINRVTRITPTSVVALVLLGHTTPSVSQTELFEEADRVLDILDALQARRSGSLAPDSRRDAIRETVDRFAADGVVKVKGSGSDLISYAVDAAGRQALDFYKNNILHFLLPYSVVSMALLSTEEGRRDTAVRDSALRISQLLKREFSFRVDGNFDQNFEEATTFLVNRRTVRRMSDEWQLEDIDETRRLAEFIASMIEAFRLLAESASQLEQEPLSLKEFIQRTLTLADHQIATKRLLRPEGVTKPSIESAVHWYADKGILERKNGKIWLKDEAGRKGLADELADLLAKL
ncbi:MAG: 1-acyl-sn-glycerol-3-phosphate acyltransferase [Myxococcota bacterium]